MKNEVVYKDLGVIDYKKAWDYQEDLFKSIQQQKTELKKKDKYPEDKTEQYLLFCEHPHVYTMGKSGKDLNLLFNEQMLKQINAGFYRINRGGDITYHGPGQIVVYPLLDLEALKMGVKEYVYKLEEVVIQTLQDYHIQASRLKGATGVWLNPESTLKVRKICAIGVRVSRYITMHGLAFNINTNLKYYQYINPCGFTDKGVTSLSEELKKEINMNELINILKEKFVKVFNMQIH